MAFESLNGRYRGLRSIAGPPGCRRVTEYDAIVVGLGAVGRIALLLATAVPTSLALRRAAEARD